MFKSLILILLVSVSVTGNTQSGSLHKVKNTPLAPDFSLYDLDENLHKLSNYHGKVVILNFWATWCPPCRFEMPSMEKAYQILKKQGIVLLAINVGEDADTIFDFTADYPVTFPLLLDLDSSVTQNYPVTGLPTSYIIDPAGKLIYRVIGTRDWADKELIKAILNLKNN